MVWGIRGPFRKLSIDTSGYIFNRRILIEKIREVFGTLEKGSHLWLIFEDKEINIEIVEHIIDSTPSDVIRLAYILSPGKELVFEEKPPWALNFETVFYDSLWEYLSGKEKKPLWQAYNEAAISLGDMFTKLYGYLAGNMLVNVDYADFLEMVRGGNVGILRLLQRVDFEWHWGVWERGLINIMAGRGVPLRDVHEILRRFQEILKEKDIIWGVRTDDGFKGLEILALLVRKW
ncbi:hypothetical protein PYCH_13030 [Pyrococcus yayanosii CH1]|uniref:Uncharacterized protein n=1 Tax=Pyrococcus yayanosii (strain CH1 / JCM 16557) TaxID=529709 RepID=F8AFK9_PYRYC|nr:hypothetical protein PYCH_13030 [Pyrococcus yayanosii CH1]